MHTFLSYTICNFCIYEFILFYPYLYLAVSQNVLSIFSYSILLTQHPTILCFYFFFFPRFFLLHTLYLLSEDFLILWIFSNNILSHLSSAVRRDISHAKLDLHLLPLFLLLFSVQGLETRFSFLPIFVCPFNLKKKKIRKGKSLNIWEQYCANMKRCKKK